jgi:hypothetical protein
MLGEARNWQSVLSELMSANRILVQQVFKPVANEYRISVPTPGSTEEGPPLLYVKQKTLAIKEDIRFRLLPDDEAYLFMIKSKSVFEFGGRHDVVDADGNPIGLLEKTFGRSLLRSHWSARDASGAEVLETQEASLFIALLRRVAGFLPEGLDVLEHVPFNFTLYRDGKEAATYNQVLGKMRHRMLGMGGMVRDRYVLELRPACAGVDVRLLVAFAVALDALQDR